MRRLWQIGERMGLGPSLACWCAWVAACALGARGVGMALSDSPRLAMAGICGVAALGAAGGLVGAWVVLQEVEFWHSGYRIRWIGDTTWLYEEKGPDRALRSIPFRREFLDQNYPAACRIFLPGESEWSARTPAWAQERRAEILDRIRERCGARAGGVVQEG